MLLSIHYYLDKHSLCLSSRVYFLWFQTTMYFQKNFISLQFRQALCMHLNKFYSLSEFLISLWKLLFRQVTCLFVCVLKDMLVCKLQGHGKFVRISNLYLMYTIPIQFPNSNLFMKQFSSRCENIRNILKPLQGPPYVLGRPETIILEVV